MRIEQDQDMFSVKRCSRWVLTASILAVASAPSSAQPSTPEALVKGRERVCFEHFWNDFAADRTRSVPEADRQL
jgi:hypothetical protein